MNKLAIVAAFALVVLAAACASSSSPAAGGGNSISSGAYVYQVTSAPVNTCWGPSKNVPALPFVMNLTASVSGDTVTFTTGTAGTGGVNTPVVLTKSGDNLSGITDTDADLNSQGLNCVLHIHANSTGTMTATDAFDSTNAITISQKSGDCSLLIGGSVSPPQFDAIPCNLTIAGHIAKP